MGASAGRVLLIPKGDWNVNTTYTGLDWVRHNGASWVCKNTCTGIEPTEANADNWQMMAMDGQNGSVINADAAMSDTSENPVQNKVIKSYVDTRTTFDSSMSDTSENPVQNKVIKSYVDNSIAGISDMSGATATQNGTHGFVPAPQVGDEKKVLLGDGTWGAIDDKFSFSDNDTATSGTSFTDAEDGNMLVTDWTKNLLNPTLDTVTQNGVTCTNNGDGTYTLNGTPTTNTEICIGTINMIDNTQYKIVGCPKQDNRNFYLFTYYKMRPSYVSAEDKGNGYIFTALEDNSSEVYIGIVSGFTCDNITFKPMLTTDLSATYDDFVPYGGYEIKSCGKNLLNVKYLDRSDLYDCISVTIENGSTFILNGKYELNDIKDIYFDFSSGSISLKKNKKYIFSADGIIDNIRVLFRKVGTYTAYVSLTTQETKYIITPDENLLLYFNINVIGQIDVNNLRINVQIEEVSLDTTEPTVYEPYTGETITVTNDTELPAFGLKSHKGITHIISQGNVKCVYPTNESGKGVLDSLYNKDKMLTEQNKNLSSQGLDNKFDGEIYANSFYDGETGELKKGYSDGIFCCKNPITVCGKKATLHYKNGANDIGFAGWDASGNYIKLAMKYNNDTFASLDLPSNVVKFGWNVIPSDKNNIGNVEVYFDNAIDEVKNDLSTKLNIVKFDEETTSYEIPTPRNYGTVIVMTAYDIYSLIYESGGAVKHQKLTSFYGNKSISSASFSNTDRKITITFNNIMWGGIKVIFQ